MQARQGKHRAGKQGTLGQLTTKLSRRDYTETQDYTKTISQNQSEK